MEPNLQTTWQLSSQIRQTTIQSIKKIIKKHEGDISLEKVIENGGKSIHSYYLVNKEIKEGIIQFLRLDTYNRVKIIFLSGQKRNMALLEEQATETLLAIWDYLEKWEKVFQLPSPDPYILDVLE